MCVLCVCVCVLDGMEWNELPVDFMILLTVKGGGSSIIEFRTRVPTNQRHQQIQHPKWYGSSTR